MNPTCSYCVGHHDRVGGKQYCEARACHNYERFQRYTEDAGPIFEIGEEAYFDGKLCTIRGISWFDCHSHWNYYDKPYEEARTFMNNCMLEKKADFEKKIERGAVKNCLDCGELKCSEKHGDKWTSCLRWHERTKK